MRDIPPAAKPSTVHPYFDNIAVWLKEPADAATIARLRRQCGYLHAANRNARFGQGYKQRLELKQPGKAALRWIAGMNDVLINRVEIALDLIFNDAREQDEAFEFLHRHLIRRWHGRTQKIKLVRAERKKRKAQVVEEGSAGATRYDAGRAPNAIAMYRNQHSRVTGELFCVHIEWRLSGVRPVRSAGIQLGSDLLGFNHRAFWERRLMLVDIDADRLGRVIRNRNEGTRSRTPEVGRFFKREINLDRKRGGVLLKSVGTVQEVIDCYGSLIPVSRILERIPAQDFLPPAGEWNAARERAVRPGILQGKCTCGRSEG